MSAGRQPRPKRRGGAFDYEKALARGKSRNACIAALALELCIHVRPVKR